MEDSDSLEKRLQRRELVFPLGVVPDYFSCLTCGAVNEKKEFLAEEDWKAGYADYFCGKCRYRMFTCEDAWGSYL